MVCLGLSVCQGLPKSANSSKLAVFAKNFKNIPKSVATRHQYYMCMQLLSPPGVSTKFLYKGDEIGKGKWVKVGWICENTFRSCNHVPEAVRTII